MLKGSFIFVADLVREIPIPIHVDFLVAASYGKQMTSSGEVRLFYNPRTSIAGRNVILVEDIIDSGSTLLRVIPLLLQGEPASLEICTLLHKRLVRLPEGRPLGRFRGPGGLPGGVRVGFWRGFSAPSVYRGNVTRP